MIYFLVNNTFHLYEVNLLASELKDYELGLIQVPYSINPLIKDTRFLKIFTFERLAFISDYFKNWPKNLLLELRNNKYKIKRAKLNLKPKHGDSLFVFTESELLNQIIINIFHEKKVNIFLLEDGMASAIYYNTKSDSIRKKAILLKYIIRALYKVKGFYPSCFNGYYYPMMSDKYFTGACFYYPAKTIRDLQVFILNKAIQFHEDKDKNLAVFLNQPLYSYYVDFNTYLSDLENILKTLGTNFKLVYFKFHPDEKDDEFVSEIRNMINKIPTVKILSTNKIIEEVTKDLNIGYAFSYYTSALKNLVYYGIEPIFLYNLVDYLKNTPISSDLTKYLQSINYNFPESLSQLKPGYKSGLLDVINKGISIKDVIENNRV